MKLRDKSEGMMPARDPFPKIIYYQETWGGFTVKRPESSLCSYMDVDNSPRANDSCIVLDRTKTAIGVVANES